MQKRIPSEATKEGLWSWAASSDSRGRESTEPVQRPRGGAVGGAGGRKLCLGSGGGRAEWSEAGLGGDYGCPRPGPPIISCVSSGLSLNVFEAQFSQKENKMAPE